jgi:hypothetical protein
MPAFAGRTFATANVNAGRIRVHYLQGSPIHLLLARLALLAGYFLLTHSDTLQPSTVILDSAGSDSEKRNLSNGVRPVPKKATDRQTNARDRMKTGATLVFGYETPVRTTALASESNSILPNVSSGARFLTPETFSAENVHRSFGETAMRRQITRIWE